MAHSSQRCGREDRDEAGRVAVVELSGVRRAIPSTDVRLSARGDLVLF